MPIGRNFQRVTTERVEMLKGPASLLYGMQEPGGVINVITGKGRVAGTGGFEPFGEEG